VEVVMGTHVPKPDDLTPEIARIRELSSRIFECRNRFEAIRDSRAVFAHAYGCMTKSLADGLTDVGFDDPRWITAMVEAFAARFFAAQTAIDEGRAIPPGWKEVGEVLVKSRTSTYEDLLLGMSAHIIYDLPHALIDTGFKDPLFRSSHLADYHRMNDVLGAAIDDIQDKVAVRYDSSIRFIDQLANRHDELLTNYRMRLWRGMAWYNAERLVQTPDDAERSIAKSPGQMVTQLLNPPFGIDLMLRLLRWVSTFFRRWPDPQE
jgi:hypothetical protein